MSKRITVLYPRSQLALAIAVCLGSGAAYAQEQTEDLDEVVVTGFRGSLNTALAEKRSATASIDVIASEDIGKFPDSNLAESMQRIPSVTLSRGDGGEGRNISVRGLGPQFTRVRVNGMEAASQTGSSDIYGAGNSGRSFDFNVFPTEIFSQLAVRKTASADVEEGSLGATVDLKAPRPFDLTDDFVLSLTARGIYNSVSEDVDPRASVLVSKKMFDDTFGVLASVAFQKRNIREAGYSAVDVLSTPANALGSGPAAAPFCTPIGWTLTPISPSPVAQGAKGATAANCSTNNPRTGTIEAYQTIYDLRRPGALDTPGSGAFLPRLPRYVNSEQDTERTGGTLTFQWVPSENTSVTLDGLMSRYQVERRDNYIAGISFGRTVTNNGQPMVSVREIAFDQHGSIESGVFDGVDIRSEGLVDQFVATFQQANLTVEQKFGDKFTLTALAGKANSIWDGPMRLQTFIDAIDVDNFTLDFSGGRETPLIGFGMDVSDPANYVYATPLADGTIRGGFSTQGKPSRNVTKNTRFELNGIWEAADTLQFKLGLQWRESDFHARTSNLVPSQVPVQNLPSGVTLTDLTHQITGLDNIFGSGAPASWLAVDSRKWRDAFNFQDADFCQVACGASSSAILEEVTSGYLMMSFNSGDSLGIPIRGDIGARYVNTRQSAIGYIPVAAPPGGPYATEGRRNDVDRAYKDLLPALNVVFEFAPDLLGRFSASKVMTRPELGNLTPTATITATTHTGTVNNPFLDPIRANTADVSLEWYFSEGSLLSAAYFYKDIETFIQRITTRVPYNELGLPDSLLDGTPSSPTDPFDVSRLENTKGGPLRGFELNAQVQLKMLPGVWSNLGFLANYTKVKSKIQYKLTAPTTANPNPEPTTADLVGLSPTSASGTLFYDDGKFSIRFTGSYRDKYIRQIPAQAGSDIQGNKANLFVDASSSWNVNDNLTLILEAQNLTDERNTLYIDSVREDTLFQTEIGRTFTVGATFKF